VNNCPSVALSFDLTGDQPVRAGPCLPSRCGGLLRLDYCSSCGPWGTFEGSSRRRREALLQDADPREIVSASTIHEVGKVAVVCDHHSRTSQPIPLAHILYSMLWCERPELSLSNPEALSRLMMLSLCAFLETGAMGILDCMFAAPVYVIISSGGNSPSRV